MSPTTGLEFCTTTDLINELMKRPTFMGVLVRSEKEVRGHAGHKDFVVQAQNMDRDHIRRVLEGLLHEMALQS